MINWSDLISKDKKTVVSFATNQISGRDFQESFSGNPNPARCVIRNHGTTYGRRLARKALRRRGIKV